MADADRARIAADLRRISRAERRLHALLVELADNGRPIAALAREMGMSRQSFYENLARWREELGEE